MLKYVLSFVVLLTLFGCDGYNKILKSNDTDEKFNAAVRFYEEDECYKALPIFEQLLGLTRGNELAEDVYYYYAMSHYCVGDYYLGGYYFKYFTKTFPLSKYAEECQFNTAMCSYFNSPHSSLDQRDTETAINDFQLFLDKYPNSALRDSSVNIINELNQKLETKSKEIAKLYVKTEKYNAAAKALQAFLDDFPLTQDREEIMFLIVKSNFFYAERSFSSKKKERFEDTVASYYTFVGSFPDSEFRNEAEGYFDKSIKELENL